ncbi:MAG: TraM recognition domain-containing protein [Pseudomonadota bacterium]|nr:TraM recognition domain-containing protein [Pseudomonadota bacterium]
MLSFLNRNSNLKSEGITLGKIKGNFFKREVLTDGQLNHHVHVVGASGYGKTVLLSHIIHERIHQGKGLLYIDLKGDSETLKKFSGFARECDREKDLQIFSLADATISKAYNLVGTGTANQIRDRLMLSLIWSEEYYKNQSASFLLKLLIGLCWLRDNKKLSVTLSLILECCLKVDKLLGLGSQVPLAEERIKFLFEDSVVFLEDKENFKSLQGLRAQIESLVFSDFGGLLSDNTDGIDLFKSVNDSKITFIFLDTRRYGESAKAVGKFIIQDLKATSARVDAEITSEKRKSFSVIIDEFADLAQEDFIGFLDRARSSRFSVVVAHQELSDLQRISPEFARRLSGNTSTMYAFLQKGPESAEMISGMAGTRTVWKKTVKAERWWLFDVRSGESSLREVEEFNIHPNRIKSLEVGECVCIKKYPRALSYSVRVKC